MNKNIVTFVLIGLLSIAVHGDDYADAGIAYDKQEYKKALNLYSQACDGGNSSGCGMAGLLYEVGKSGVERNSQEALAYYSKACDMESELGCKEFTRLKAKVPVCTEDEISFINDKRYFYLSSGVGYSSIHADGKTITIDKKNKIINVWTAWLVRENGRQSMIDKIGKNGNYDNYGYDRDLDIINYASMKSKNSQSIKYNCNGSVITSSKSQGEWASIVPGSVMEGITERIVKKYNLK